MGTLIGVSNGPVPVGVSAQPASGPPGWRPPAPPVLHPPTQPVMHYSGTAGTTPAPIDPNHLTPQQVQWIQAGTRPTVDPNHLTPAQIQWIQAGTRPTTPPSGNPLDSTYFQQLNNATLQANQKINGYDEQSGYARVDLQSNLDKLAHQQPIDTLNMQEKYNKAGLLYSGHLGQGLGELNRNYLDRQSALQQGFERQQAARDAAVAAIRSGLTLQQAALYAAAVDRASQNAQKDPTLSQSPAPLTPPAGNPKPPPPPAPPASRTRAVTQGSSHSPGRTVPIPKGHEHPALQGLNPAALAALIRRG